MPVRYAYKLLDYFARRNANASKYTFDNLGWKKKKFAWGGKGPAYSYYDPAANPERGRLYTGNYSQTIEAHINDVLTPALEVIGFGIRYEELKRSSDRNYDDVPF